MTLDGPRLGSFSLRQPLGRGGMGIVWRAVHVDTGMPVAVKVVRLDEAGPEAERMLRTEARAIAALDHPGIVSLLDQGRVPRDAADAEFTGRTGGPAPDDAPQLVPGSAWFAMELVSGGSLQDWYQDLSWPGSQRVLLALLDALGHAHARGVVHRDLKPGNVLVASPDDVRPGLKLTDFGIAAVLDWHVRAGSLSRVAGTLHYMAPEQILGHWREIGPWTDLYSLGCLAWRLLTGHTPYHGRRGAGLLHAQLLEPPPVFEPRQEVPDGVEAWLRRLLEKPIAERFERSADAALELARFSAEATGRSGGEVLVGWGREAAEWWRRGAAGVAGSRWVPGDWSHPNDAAARATLEGVGLGSWGMRVPRFVGRREERDRLWAELRGAVQRGAPRAVLLTGPEGAGKTRLLDWICQRAHEVGAATIARAVGRREEAPGTALRRMLESVLGTRGLRKYEVRDRVAEWLAQRGSADAELVGVLSAALADPAPTGPVRYPAIGQLFEILARGRVPLLAIDDIEADPDLLGLVQWLLVDGGGPLLVVATARGVGAERGAEAELFEQLAGRSEVTTLSLEALPDAEHHALVRSLLGFEGGLAAELADRTRGNPGFAVALAGEWVARGSLVHGDGGLVLRASAGSELPIDIRRAWLERVARALEGLPARALEYLERAAILGVDPDPQLWTALCPDPGLRAAVTARLSSAQLVSSDARWSFVHAALPEAIEEQAGERAATAHRAAAAALSPRLGEPGNAERIGRHLLAAGDRDAAVEPLLLGARERFRSTGPRPAMVVLRTVERTLEALAAPPSDPRWGALAVARAHVLQALGQPDEACRLAGDALAAAVRHGWPSRFGAALEHARGLLSLGEVAAAEVVAGEVARAVAASHEERAASVQILAFAAVRSRSPAARSLLEEAAEAHRLDPAGRAECLRRLAVLPDTSREDGVALLGEALDIAVESGRLALLARCCESEAELARRAGDGERALASARRAVRTWDAVWPEGGLDAHLLVARLQIGLARHADAAASAREAIALLVPYRDDARALAEAVLLCAATAAADWTAWDRHLRIIAGWSDRDSTGPEGLSDVLDVAGELALARGEHDRARASWVLGRELALDEAGRDALSRRLDGLRSA